MSHTPLAPGVPLHRSSRGTLSSGPDYILSDAKVQYWRMDKPACTMYTESISLCPELYVVYSPIFKLEWHNIDAALQRLRDGHPGYYPAMTTNAQGCWIANKRDNGHGYVKMKVKGSNRKEYYAHHLSLIHAGDRGAVAWVHCKDDGDYEISHLCHTTRCFNPDHLIVERKSENLARNSCRGLTWIQCPCPCKHQFNPCPHIVPCILPTPNFASPTAI